MGERKRERERVRERQIDRERQREREREERFSDLSFWIDSTTLTRKKNSHR